MILSQRQRSVLSSILKTERDHGVGWHMLFTRPGFDRTVASLERRGLVDAATDPRYAVSTEAGRELAARVWA
jgi:DNA-binding MarR family transcriptional regulator